MRNYIHVLFSLLIFTFSSYSADHFFKLVKGEVSINGQKIGNQWKKSKIKKDDIITTGAKSLAILVFENQKDKFQFKLNENSQIKLDKLPLRSSPQSILKILKGSIFSSLEGEGASQKDKLILKAKSAAMGVRGTKFFTGLGKGKDVWMCVESGIVEVKNKIKTVSVKKGEGVRVSSAKEMTDPTYFPWTKKLNWEMDPNSKNLENHVDLKDVYRDPLGTDYD